MKVKWHSKTSKTNHHDVWTYVEAYVRLYYHIRLRAITQVILTSHILS